MKEVKKSKESFRVNATMVRLSSAVEAVLHHQLLGISYLKSVHFEVIQRPQVRKHSDISDPICYWINDTYLVRTKAKGRMFEGGKGEHHYDQLDVMLVLERSVGSGFPLSTDATWKIEVWWRSEDDLNPPQKAAWEAYEYYWSLGTPSLTAKQEDNPPAELAFKISATA